jgi:hypothetical protein
MRVNTIKEIAIMFKGSLATNMLSFMLASLLFVHQNHAEEAKSESYKICNRIEPLTPSEKIIEIVSRSRSNLSNPRSRARHKTNIKRFIKDKRQSLAFSFSVVIESVINGSDSFLILLPYVKGPDNTIYKSNPIDATAGGLFVSPPIVVTDPIFGVYEFGYVLQGMNMAGTLIAFDYPEGDFTVRATRFGNIPIHCASADFDLLFTSTVGLPTY